MASLYLDRLDTLKMEEVNGVIRSLTRKGRIVDLVSFDYTVLLQAYAQVGLPTPGTFLSLPPLAPPSPLGSKPANMLVLAKRDFDLVLDKNAVDVVLTYQHFMDGDNQNLSPNAVSANNWVVPSSPVMFGKNRASVQQTKSNFYLTNYLVSQFDGEAAYSIGDFADWQGLYWIFVSLDVLPAPQAPPPGVNSDNSPAAIGVIWRIASEADLLLAVLNLNPTVQVAQVPQRRQIVVGHQFPGSGPTKDPLVPGQTLYQTGEITYMQPNDNFKMHGQVFIANPRNLKLALLGAINSVPWLDGKPYTWMCTEVAWEPLYVGSGQLKNYQWKVSLEFQQNEDTWLPTAVFNDQRTGRPPADLIPNFGFRSISKHKVIDFENYFTNVLGAIFAAGN